MSLSVLKSKEKKKKNYLLNENARNSSSYLKMQQWYPMPFRQYLDTYLQMAEIHQKLMSSHYKLLAIYVSQEKR